MISPLVADGTVSDCVLVQREVSQIQSGIVRLDFAEGAWWRCLVEDVRVDAGCRGDLDEQETLPHNSRCTD